LEANELQYYEQLAQLLRDCQGRNPRLKGWRFDLHQSHGLEIGLKNNKIGGPYSTPGYKESISGEIYLIWEDCHYTSAKLDSQVGEHFDEYLNLWHATAYHDPDGVGLYQPERLPETPLSDEPTVRVAGGDFEPAFQLLSRGLQELRAAGVAKVDAKFKCFESRRYLANSAGLTVAYPQTPLEFYFIANDSYGEGYAEKRWPTEAEVVKTIRETARIGKLLQHPVAAKLAGPLTVLLPPDIFEALLSHFLITNLYGSLVVNRQSRFTATDFQTKRQVLREDLDLSADPLQPYRSFSYNCTSEAVPAKAQTFISNGRLASPILNLKYARKMGLEPTALPGGDGFFLKCRSSLPTWDELIGQTKRGLIVYSVLGLHTQDASSGLFSLTADQCLLVEKGKITGKTKAVLNGDFLGSLLREDSHFGAVAGEDNPGYAFTANALN
jgi:PmbA protein